MGFWPKHLRHLRITAEAYPPHGAAAHPAQLSACAMHPCTLRRAACCSQRVDSRISRAASCAIHAGSLRGAACCSRRAAQVVMWRHSVVSHFACSQRCWPRRKGICQSCAVASVQHIISLHTKWSSSTSSSVSCLCNASVYSETCSIMLQSARGLSQL